MTASGLVRFTTHAALWLVCVPGCTRGRSDGASAAASSSATRVTTAAPLGSAAVFTNETRPGMVLIPGGALVAGSSPETQPRRADRELSGEQVILKPFFIDVFPYPNESGAIPKTGVTQAQAAALCAERERRLCTELEWERACKGPSNLTHAWGQRFRVEWCGLGVTNSEHPSGLRVACRSEFGVRDLHGGPFEWTASPWLRGNAPGQFAVRGGNGVDAELVGRCANAEPRVGTAKSAALGFRCCAGPTNKAEVILALETGPAFSAVEPPDPKVAARLLALLPDTARAQLDAGAPEVQRIWRWRPLPADPIEVLGVCTRARGASHCGLLLARDTPGRPVFLTFALTGSFLAAPLLDDEPRRLWVAVGTGSAAKRRVIRYSAGRVELGTPEPRRKKRRSDAGELE